MTLLAHPAAMKGWTKALVAVALVVLLLMACLYVYREISGTPDSDRSGGMPSGSDVRVNDSAVSVYISGFEPSPDLDDLQVRLYTPDRGHGDWNLSSSTPLGGNWSKDSILPGIGLSYRDLNNDGEASNGEYFTVLGEGPLSAGIWHIEIGYPGSSHRNATFHFHVYPDGTEALAQDLEVDFIDVGQGDAELITTSDGRHILIDAGPYDSSASLISYLNARSITVLDALILSHPDADHIGGAASVLGSFEVLSVYHPGLAKDTSTYRTFIDASEAEGCPVLTSSGIDAGDYLNLSLTEDFRVLSINASATSNDASIVLWMESENTTFLFTGDIGSSVESTVMGSYPGNVDVDFLKVAHHGSRYSTSDAFLDAATPRYGVIEVGEGNTYGHPHAETLERLADHQATVVRTDLTGTYEVHLRGGGL